MRLFRRKNTTIDEEEMRAREEFWQTYGSMWGQRRPEAKEESIYNANLMLVGANLTQICHPNGGSSKEVLGTYTEMMEGLLDWLNIVPLRERLEGMLDEQIWSKWSPPQQPVVPLYTPQVKIRKGSNSSGCGTV